MHAIVLAKWLFSSALYNLGPQYFRFVLELKCYDFLASETITQAS